MRLMFSERTLHFLVSGEQRYAAFPLLRNEPLNLLWRCLISRCRCWWAAPAPTPTPTPTPSPSQITGAPAAQGWRFMRVSSRMCFSQFADCCSYFNLNKVIMNMQIESFANCRSQPLPPRPCVCSKLSRNFGKNSFRSSNDCRCRRVKGSAAAPLPAECPWARHWAGPVTSDPSDQIKRSAAKFPVKKSELFFAEALEKKHLLYNNLLSVF